MTSEWGSTAADCAPRLAGAWTIRREIIGAGARFSGEAAFRPLDDGRLAYAEHGRLDLPDGTSLKGEQSYFFTPADDGFAVHFDETPPRLFHDVSLQVLADGGFAGEATHLCVDDIYSSRYLFLPDGSFETTHVVSGPKKDYTVRSIYTRRPVEAP